jgi:hypothetical protein
MSESLDILTNVVRDIRDSFVVQTFHFNVTLVQRLNQNFLQMEISFAFY